MFDNATKKMMEDFLRDLRRTAADQAEQQVKIYLHGIVSPGGTIVPNALPPASRGYWEPLTNGDPDFPEVMFDDDGDILMEQVI